MKKSLYILGGLDRGGAESYLMNSLRNMDRSKYSFIIATFMSPTDGKKYAYEDEVRKMGIKLIRLRDTRTSKPWDFVKQIETIVREENVDIVHSHIDFNSALTLSGGRRGGAKKLIAHSHNTNNVNLKSFKGRLAAKLMRRRLNRLADVRIACGEEAGKFLFGRNRYTVISSGINLDTFKFNEQYRKELREKYKISKDTRVWLTVGRLEEVKNHDFLLSLLTNYRDQCPNTQLFIIGDGSLADQYKERIKQLKLAKQVHLLPSRADINKYYSMADVFMLPSFFEGVPTVGIEAQANGLKCLFSTNVPIQTKLLNTSEFLLLDHPQDWVKAAQEITPISARKNATKVAAVQEFNVKKLVKKLEEIYDAE